MANEVYADMMEIACKAGMGKVIAAFPDVCLSPPSPPAGPIPVPYPDTSFSKDMQNGSQTVKISGKEVMLKDQSFYKSAPLGDEAATQGLGAGVITHVITGKTYFTAWSMDVKFEGANVDRHVDLTTSNHASPAGNSMIQANFDSMNLATMTPECQAATNKAKEAHNTAQPKMQDGASYVVAGGQFVPAGGGAASGSMGASMVGSRHVVFGGRYKGFARGTSMKEGSRVSCGGKKHTYAHSMHMGHAEPKIIEDLFKNGPPQGTLHLQVVGEPICSQCQKLICCARENPGFKVVVCPPQEDVKCP